MNKKFKCIKCEGKLIQEAETIFFCENCKIMLFKNEEGKFEIRKAHKIN